MTARGQPVFWDHIEPILEQGKRALRPAGNGAMPRHELFTEDRAGLYLPVRGRLHQLPTIIRRRANRIRQPGTQNLVFGLAIVDRAGEFLQGGAGQQYRIRQKIRDTMLWCEIRHLEGGRRFCTAHQQGRGGPMCGCANVRSTFSLRCRCKLPPGSPRAHRRLTYTASRCSGDLSVHEFVRLAGSRGLAT